MLSCVGLLFTYDPATSQLFPPCPFHAVTGLYCPGCGSLRALHHLLHGDLAAAVRLNPLMVLSIPILCLLSAFPRWTYRPWVSWSALTILIAYGIVRNIPAWPFCCLSPHVS